MTARLAVVGHVEWVEFVPVDRIPGRGEIAHGGRSRAAVGGGGAVAAVQLARLAGDCTLYTALGHDAIGRRARDALERLGVRVEAALRNAPTRRAVTLVDPQRERTITTIGERLAPVGDDPLPWHELGGMDGAYFTAGDEGALRAARTAGVLVATSRVLEEIEPWGVPLDALVGSAEDPSEAFDVERLAAPPTLAVLTEGPAGGRYWTPEEGWDRYPPAPAPGPAHDAYGAGDSFAAGLTFGLASGLSLSQVITDPASPEHPALQRPRPDPQHRGCLAVAQSEHLDEDERLPKLRGEGIHGPAQRDAEPRIRPRGGRLRPLRQSALMRPTAHGIHRSIAGDPVEPGRELRGSAEAGQGPEGAEERLLRHVLGRRAVPDDVQHEPEHRPLRDPDQLLERLQVSGHRPGDDLGLRLAHGPPPRISR